MAKKYLKKIIAQSAQDLKVISACCEGGKIKIDDIKYLPKNKIFLFLIERIAREKENSKEIVKSVVNSNEKRKTLLTKKILTLLNNNLNNKIVTFLGVTFKPNTDDMREASSIPMIKYLSKKKCNLR